MLDFNPRASGNLVERDDDYCTAHKNTRAKGCEHGCFGEDPRDR